ncbi:MAG: polysaccharide deacetylase family protein [Clostridia bacterium]|nr:polysaccharide deacetylase family protein [Clostridia bacterium]
MKRVYVVFAMLILLIVCACSAEPVQLSVVPLQTTVEPQIIAVELSSTPLPTPVPTPTEVPTPSPVPTFTPTPSPSPTPDPNRKVIALTFDDGPNEKYTALILDLLEQYQVKATFFVLGNSIGGNEQLLLRMDELGCEIGCHSWSHADMTKQSKDEMRRHFALAVDRISGCFENGYTVTLMRPPYGATDSSVYSVMKEMGLAVIKWNVDSRDWESKNADKVFKLCTDDLEPGQILLFHDRMQSTVDAIGRLIPYFLENGYELVTVTELIESGGQAVTPGKGYSKRP